MSSPSADTLTRSVWLDRVVMIAFVLVFGVTFLRGALGGPLRRGPDWWQLGLSVVSAGFWLVLIRGVAAVVGGGV